MNIDHLFTLLSAIALGGIITVVAGYLLIRNDIQQYFRFKAMAHRKEDRSAIFPLRLQAYERLIIFLDRINPSNLLVRVHQQGIGVSALQALILEEIKSEYQHNITQQLYIDPVSWTVVRKLKEDTIAMVNNVANNLNETATGVDLSKTILQHMSKIDENPYELAIDQLKLDIQKLF
ncbi:MAG: hypothetical protein REI78_10510 [Pedobacter sp.]|nr:hypothetical protein [Pedobacter sp.]